MKGIQHIKNGVSNENIEYINTMKNDEIELVRENDDKGNPILFYLKRNGIEVPKTRIKLDDESNEREIADYLYYVKQRLEMGMSARIAVIKPGEENL